MDIRKFVINKTINLNKDNTSTDEYKISRHQKLYDDAKNRFLAKKYDEVIKQLWEDDLIEKEFKELYLKVKTNNSDNSRFIWLTINPRKEITLEEFIKTIKKYVKRTFIKSYYYVYEQRASQRNEKDMGDGLHAHLLLERNEEANIKMYDIKKRTKDSFRQITDVENSNIFYYKLMPEKFIIDKLNYMNNKNLDDEHQDKLEKQEYDKKWRNLNKLQDTYSTFKISDYNIVYNKNAEIFEKETKIEKNGQAEE